jgi:hypothetical protein
MRYGGATQSSFWPEPDKWDLIDVSGIHRKCEQLFLDALDRVVNRPVRELNSLPSTKVDPLQMFAKGDCQEWP